MTSRLIDVSVRLEAGMPTWPGSAGFTLSRSLDMALGDSATVSTLNIDVHCGTHVEAPLHFVADGHALDAYPLELFVGDAYVAEVPSTATISARDLGQLEIPPGTERLLLRTINSALWRKRPQAFHKEYVALSADAAQWIADRGVRLVGIDYLSIQPYRDGAETHRILMRAGVAILEGLDLSEAPAGRYRLLTLPLRLSNAEASPVRAVLERVR